MFLDVIIWPILVMYGFFLLIILSMVIGAIICIIIVIRRNKKRIAEQTSQLKETPDKE
jgi:Flp pilus assembly protein TadB